MSPTAPCSHSWGARKRMVITCGTIFSSPSKITITSVCLSACVCVFPARKDCVYLYRLGTVRNVFTKRVIKYWNTLPKGGGGVTVARGVKGKTGRDTVPRSGNTVVFGHSLDSMISEVFSDLIESVIPRYKPIQTLGLETPWRGGSGRPRRPRPRS